MSNTELKRELGVFGAMMMGLGSIIGTGVFVSIGTAAGITGPAVIIAVMVGAGVAACNGISSAQLAANHPVSGGTYEYGYRYLNPLLGFTAGWMFLLAKSASAATAALGFSGYLLDAINADFDLLIPLALGAVATLTLITLYGIRRSNIVNIIIVSITLTTLALFVVLGLGKTTDNFESNFTPFFNGEGIDSVRNLLWASALMFVAYTGYGRIATLGEEVREPRRTIPRAIIATLLVTMLLYISVAFVSVGAVGQSTLTAAVDLNGAPLEAVAATFELDAAPQIIAIGAITAMLGVLLNLILGLSRVMFAMGRRGDMPPVVAQVNMTNSSPNNAIIVMGLIIGGLVLIGDVRTTWSFSAFTVLIYYAITNLSALQLTDDERLFPRWISWLGLGACVFLAFWVEPAIWIVGLGLIGAGLIWKTISDQRR